MTICSMTRSKVKVKVTGLLKLEIFQFSKVISSTIYNGNGSWQLTTDSETRAGFFIFVLVFVSRDFGRNVSRKESIVSPASG